MQHKAAMATHSTPQQPGGQAVVRFRRAEGDMAKALEGKNP